MEEGREGGREGDCKVGVRKRGRGWNQFLSCGSWSHPLPAQPLSLPHLLVCSSLPTPSPAAQRTLWRREREGREIEREEGRQGGREKRDN